MSTKLCPESENLCRFQEVQICPRMFHTLQTAENICYVLSQCPWAVSGTCLFSDNLSNDSIPDFARNKSKPVIFSLANSVDGSLDFVLRDTWWQLTDDNLVSNILSDCHTCKLSDQRCWHTADQQVPKPVSFELNLLGFLIDLSSRAARKLRNL